tara:strand:- start:495 stop:671 length:177 start_codon:yes stop_codon:yes gene_type:complete
MPPLTAPLYFFRLISARLFSQPLPIPVRFEKNKFLAGDSNGLSRLCGIIKVSRRNIVN